MTLWYRTQLLTELWTCQIKKKITIISSHLAGYNGKHEFEVQYSWFFLNNLLLWIFYKFSNIKTHFDHQVRLNYFSTYALQVVLINASCIILNRFLRALIISITSKFISSSVSKTREKWNVHAECMPYLRFGISITSFELRHGTVLTSPFFYSEMVIV